MNDIQIRDACENDIQEILNLYRVLLNEEIDENKAITTLKKIKLSNNTFVFVAELQNTIVGTIQVTMSLGMGFNCCPFLVLEYFIVKENFRKSGIGSAFLKKVDDIAIEHNCSFTILVSSEIRKDAHRLYEKCGYNKNVVGFRKEY